jgi:hypothetical protein
MSAAVFSESTPSMAGNNTSGDPPETAAQSATVPIQDKRTDFNVVFIHSRLDDYGLPPAEFRVYAHIARRAGSGMGWPAVKSIAGVCRLHPQTVRHALRVLVSHRLLRRVDRPGQTAVYTITPASAWQPPERISDPYEKDTPPSDSQATPTQRIQGHPYETDGAEGNPIEGNPLKAITHTPRTTGIPRNESEAIEAATGAGVPEDFARTEFNRMEAVNWVDGCQRQVRSWPHYIKQRWSKEQSERAERQTRAAARPGRNSGFVPPRQFDPTNYQQPVEKF